MNPITNRAHSTKNPPDPTRIPRIPTSGQHSEIYPQKPIPNPPAFIANPSKNANVSRLRNKINHSALHDTPHSVSRMTPKKILCHQTPCHTIACTHARSKTPKPMITTPLAEHDHQETNHDHQKDDNLDHHHHHHAPQYSVQLR